jgi:polyhydroxyalkanoate synthesis regulator phasin
MRLPQRLRVSKKISKNYSNKGEKMFKDLIYAGIGAATVLKEKVEEEVKKLEEQGKLKTSDAKSFLESIEKKGKEEETRLKDELKRALKEVIDELGLATKADIEKLKEDLK